MEGKTTVTNGNMPLIVPAAVMRVNKYLMLCRLNFSNLCRTMWVQGGKQVFSSCARIMLKYTWFLLDMRKEMTLPGGGLFFFVGCFLEVISYNFSFSVVSQGTKPETSIS